MRWQSNPPLPAKPHAGRHLREVLAPGATGTFEATVSQSYARALPHNDLAKEQVRCDNFPLR